MGGRRPGQAGLFRDACRQDRRCKRKPAQVRSGVAKVRGQTGTNPASRWVTRVKAPVRAPPSGLLGIRQNSAWTRATLFLGRPNHLAQRGYLNYSRYRRSPATSCLGDSELLPRKTSNCAVTAHHFFEASHHHSTPIPPLHPLPSTSSVPKSLSES